jgi:hypothetical protein
MGVNQLFYLGVLEQLVNPHNLEPNTRKAEQPQTEQQIP